MKRPFCVYLEFNKKKKVFPYIKLKQSSLAIQEYFSYLEKKRREGHDNYLYVSSIFFICFIWDVACCFEFFNI